MNIKQERGMDLAEVLDTLNFELLTALNTAYDSDSGCYQQGFMASLYVKRAGFVYLVATREVARGFGETANGAWRDLIKVISGAEVQVWGNIPRQILIPKLTYKGYE